MTYERQEVLEHHAPAGLDDVAAPKTAERAEDAKIE